VKKARAGKQIFSGFFIIIYLVLKPGFIIAVILGKLSKIPSQKSKMNFYSDFYQNF